MLDNYEKLRLSTHKKIKLFNLEKYRKDIKFFENLKNHFFGKTQKVLKKISIDI